MHRPVLRLQAKNDPKETKKWSRRARQYRLRAEEHLRRAEPQLRMVEPDGEQVPIREQSTTP